MAGEGTVRITKGGQSNLTTFNLNNGVFDPFQINFVAGADIIGDNNSLLAGGVKIILHCGPSGKAGMFFESPSGVNVSIDLVEVWNGLRKIDGELGTDFNVTYGGDPITSIKITPRANRTIKSGYKVDVTYSGLTPKISTRWATGGVHFLRVLSLRSNALDANYVELSSLPTFSVPGSSIVTKLVPIVPMDILWLGTESELFDVYITAIDAMGQVAANVDGIVDISTNMISNLPAQFTFTPTDNGIKEFKNIKITTLHQTDRYFDITVSSGSISGLKNASKVHETVPTYRRVIGNIHCHTRLTDHCGEYVRYEEPHYFMSMVWGLNFGAVTNHDYTAGDIYMPVSQVDEEKPLRRLMQSRNYHAYGAYEFSDFFNGYMCHVNILQLIEDVFTVVPCGNDGNENQIDTDISLIDALNQLAKLGPIMAIPHLHSSSNIQWKNYNDPVYIPLVEHNSNKNPVDDALYFEGDSLSPAAYTIRSAWAAGNIIGVCASADEHNGGSSGIRFFSGLNSEQLDEIGGLTVVLTPNNERADIWNSLLARRTYATSLGNRAWVDFKVSGYEMGEKVGLASLATTFDVIIDVIGDDTLDSVRLFKCLSGTWSEVSLTGNTNINARTWTFTKTENKPNAFCLYYLRVKQTDGTYAATSPVFLSDKG